MFFALSHGLQWRKMCKIPFVATNNLPRSLLCSAACAPPSVSRHCQPRSVPALPGSLRLSGSLNSGPQLFCHRCKISSTHPAALDSGKGKRNATQWRVQTVSATLFPLLPTPWNQHNENMRNRSGCWPEPWNNWTAQRLGLTVSLHFVFSFIQVMRSVCSAWWIWSV